MKRSITVVFLLLLVLGNTKAQKAETALSAFSAAYPTEKLYLHYDKEYYVSGETIWFKAYFYNNGKPSGLSNNLYLQFTDSKGKVIIDGRYPVQGAVTKGSISIPDSISQGNYIIRAFTPGMLNFDQPLIYKKNIFVFKPSSPKSSTEQSQNISLQFFPESGYLVDGIQMVTGFKATDQWGAPADVKGVIKTEDGTTVTAFSSYHDGIGRVIFTPQAGKKYIAEVQTLAGPRTYTLPEVRPSGINLDVQDVKGGKRIQLSRSEKDKTSFDNLLVVAQINNQVVFENEITFDNFPSVAGEIGTGSLPSGILHFTVLNKDGLPLAERLTFVDNGEYRTSASISTPKFSVEKKALNEFDISFPDIMQRSLSVSVTAVPAFSFNDDDNIYSQFLLTGDLKGHINDPAWYFENPNDSTRMALDNLMITQGWSRFNWISLLKGTLPEKKYTDPLFISVSGTVKDERTKELFSGGKLNFFVEAEDSSRTPYEAIVDAKGRFKIDSLIFSGRSKFFYAYTDAKEKQRSAVIALDNSQENFSSISPQNPENNILRNTVSSNKGEIDARYSYVQTQFNEVKELERVTLHAKSRKKPIDLVNERYTKGVFQSGEKESLDNINAPANDKSLNVVDYIKNSIQQVELQNGQFVNRKNMSLMTGRKWLVGVFIDQVPSSISQLRTMRIQDVALIKFFDAGFVGVGSEFPGGAIAVYTKDQSKEEPKPDKLDYFEYRGYAITKEFYNPDYSTGGAKLATIDNRTTLYWNPDIFTDVANRSVKIRFFNNDFSKKFKIVMEGFDADGKLIHVEKIIGN